jgi:hypothetical protein
MVREMWDDFKNKSSLGCCFRFFESALALLAKTDPDKWPSRHKPRR